MTSLPKGGVDDGGASSVPSVFERLDTVGPINIPTCLVVAHPDDETHALAGSMVRFTQLTVVHATDGVPQNLPPSAKGATPEQVLQTRQAETRGALRAALAAPIRQIRYGYTDGALINDFHDLVDRLARDLILSDAVLTHAYEGGHIDHDVCSLAVHLACARLKSLAGRSPEHLEFSGYYPRRGRPCADGFSNVYTSQTKTLMLSESARHRREMAFACHRSQEEIMKLFSRSVERFRRAPAYQYRTPLPEVLYGPLELGRLHEKISQISSEDPSF